MPVSVKPVDAEPILHAIVREPFVVADDMPPLLAQLTAQRQRMDCPVVVILDVAELALSFEKVTMALNRAAWHIRAQREHGSQLPLQYVFIGTDAMVALVSDAMNQDQYGGVGGHLVATWDEALAHARRLLADIAPQA